MPTRSLHVVLIQPHTPADGPFERLGRSDLPPLGLLYLAAALERAGRPPASMKVLAARAPPSPTQPQRAAAAL